MFPGNRRAIAALTRLRGRAASASSRRGSADEPRRRRHDATPRTNRVAAIRLLRSPPRRRCDPPPRRRSPRRVVASASPRPAAASVSPRPGSAQVTPETGADRNWLAASDDEVVEATLSELRQLFPDDMRGATLRKSAVVRVPRSVYAAVPGRNKYRPSQKTPVPNLTLCGCYTSQKFLGSMEGAVRRDRADGSRSFQEDACQRCKK